MGVRHIEQSCCIKALICHFQTSLTSPKFWQIYQARSVSMRPVVIAVAITGSLPCKKDNPAVPVTVSEQVESTHEAFEAGASLVHIHVRNPDETPSSDPALFAAVQEGVRKHCPGMIVQFSTGGRGRDPAARANALDLKPDMASLSTGSVNFPSIVYENATSLVEFLASRMKEFHVLPEIEIFDLSHLHAARRLVDEGFMSERPHVQFVLGVKNALPAQERLLDILLGELKIILPKATWAAAGIGVNQAPVQEWALRRGADGLRTGLEDNIRVNRDRLAVSNAELVGLAAEICARHNARPASPPEARAMLGLTPAA
jgi:3-keto-5-aminohexanoate cleavage enzyme